MSEKTAGRIAWWITDLSALLIATGVLLGALAILRAGSPVGLLSHQLTIPISGAFFAWLGWLMLPRHPRHPIAWMLAGLGLVSGFEVLNLGYLAYMSLEAPGELIQAAGIAHWLAQWIFVPRAHIPITLLLLLFPDGKLPSHRWQVVAWAAALGLVVSSITGAFKPGSWEGLGGIVHNPYAIQSAIWDPMYIVSGALLFVAMLASQASIFVRFRRARGIQRQQLKWMAYAIVIILIALAVAAALFFVLPDTRLAIELVFSIQNVVTTGIAVAATIAVLRHRLYNIDLIINRTLVYGVLTASVIGLYVLIVGVLGTFFQAQGNLLVGLVATGIVAVLFQPLREKLQRSVDRLLFGQRDDPLSALTQLGKRLEAAIALDSVLSTLVETIAHTMKLPYVAVSLKTENTFKIAAQIGNDGNSAKVIPLTHQGEIIGELIAGARAPDEVFSRDDERLLEHIAHQAGPAIYSVQAKDALQRSRHQLVTAREEERRRLRRDLHDGLGATLAGLHLETGALRRLIRSDPAAAEGLADEFRRDIRAAIEDIRRLVYELRPPTLDQLGLVEAVRSYAVQISRSEVNGDSDLQIRVDAQKVLPSLSAAVEVAGFRIVQEAMTNVVHHAKAKHCIVRIVVNDKLRVEVEDDGVGMVNGREPNAGLGLVSMRERAEELGGTFLVESLSEGGTRVVASLPIEGE